MKRSNKYSLQLVKEQSFLYDVNKVTSPNSAAQLIRDLFKLHMQAEEVLFIVCLDTKNNIIGCFEVGRGSLNTAIVHPREIFKRALLLNSSRFVLFHNHPSNDTSPSKEDISITNRLKECGVLIGVELLDHIIICDETHFSFKEKGLI
ncbi:MAG: JAB domain-containing protein [Clostridium sp.]